MPRGDERDLGAWFLDWLPEARRIAHKRCNWIDSRISKVERDAKLARLRAALRRKVRLQGWETALSMWYTVDIDGNGVPQRHFSIETSIWTPPDETDFKARANAMKPMWLELLTPLVQPVFPMHNALRQAIIVGDHVPVQRQNKETGERQVKLRNPVAFHFLVRHDMTEGVAGAADTGPRGKVLDMHGNPVKRRGFVNVADEPADA